MATTLLFAIAPSHWMAASWPSARHVAIAGALGLALTLLHDVRARSGALSLAPPKVGEAVTLHHEVGPMRM